MLKVEKEKIFVYFIWRFEAKKEKEKDGAKKWTFFSQSPHKNPYEFSFMTFQPGLVLLLGFSGPYF